MLAVSRYVDLTMLLFVVWEVWLLIDLFCLWVDGLIACGSSLTWVLGVACLLVVCLYWWCLLFSLLMCCFLFVILLCLI